MGTPLAGRATLLVCSCDAYADLWTPFFTLLKKYWTPLDIPVLLNTESRDFSLPGLDITCVHTPGDAPYGARLLHALQAVKTDYTIILLDDFFLRRPVDWQRMAALVAAMDADPDIVYFNCDCTQAQADCELGRYPGFRRLPPGNLYTLNLQGAIWRTDKLRSYWQPEVSPWEWEEYCNLRTLLHPQDKFYCVTAPQHAFFDYAYNPDGMGVFHGKWVESDVVPLFEKEGIAVDFTPRGFYTPAESAGAPEPFAKKIKRYRRLMQLLTPRELALYLLFGRKRQARGLTAALQRWVVKRLQRKK